jgi:hypothetical protein
VTQKQGGSDGSRNDLSRLLSLQRPAIAVPAEHRFSVRGPEWNHRFHSALDALHARLEANRGRSDLSLRLALLAMTGIAAEVLFMKKFLLCGRKDKFVSAVNANQGPVGKVHDQPPSRPCLCRERGIDQSSKKAPSP